MQNIKKIIEIFQTLKTRTVGGFFSLTAKTGIMISTFLLSGCHAAMLDPKGLIAQDEKSIMILSAILMLLVIIPVIFLTLFVVWRYREGNEKATYAPEWAHSTALEIVWWTIPIIIVSVLGYMTWTSSHRLDPYRPIESNVKPVVIKAIALRWKWLFIYPDQHVATINYVDIPVNTPITFLITAEGPMNSLQIPQLAGQIYAMAGMQTKLHLIANAEGDYRGISANFSGDGFSEMKFNVHVESPKGFEHWAELAKKTPDTLSYNKYLELAKPSTNNPVKYFALNKTDIFETVMLEIMMPGHTGDICTSQVSPLATK